MSSVPPGDRANVCPIPRLHVITADRVLTDPDFVSAARRVLRAGGGDLALHLRGRAISGRLLFERATALKGVAVECGSRIVVNDRVDVALAAEADGVQLGGRSLRVPDLPAGTRFPLGVGVSVHGAEEARAAGAADWLLIGTLWPTPSHPDRPGSGIARIPSVLSARRDIPGIGIGGVTPSRVEAVLRAGAHGVAVLSAIWDAPDPAAAVERYLEALGTVSQTGS